MSEYPISAEKAKAILGDEYIDGQDYWLRETDDGEEEVWGWGEDAPAAVNDTNTSWASPGYPEG